MAANSPARRAGRAAYHRERYAQVPDRDGVLVRDAAEIGLPLADDLALADRGMALTGSYKTLDENLQQRLTSAKAAAEGLRDS